MPLPYVWYRQKVLKPFVSALCIFLLKIPLSIRKCGAKKKKTKTTKPEKKNKLKLSFGVGGGERFPNGGLWAEEIMYEWRAAKTFVQSKVECIISSVRQYNFFCFCFVSLRFPRTFLRSSPLVCKSEKKPGERAFLLWFLRRRKGVCVYTCCHTYT